LRVLLAPPLIDPDFETLAHVAWLRHGGGHELRRDVEAACVNRDLLDASRRELPHRDVVTRIGDGHVEHRVEVLAERGEGEGDASDARAKQVAIRRILIGVLVA